MLDLIGGPDRDRTDDLFHAMEARSQLRHRPTCCTDATFLLSPLGRDSSISTLIQLRSYLVSNLYPASKSLLGQG